MFVKSFAMQRFLLRTARKLVKRSVMMKSQILKRRKKMFFLRPIKPSSMEQPMTSTPFTTNNYQQDKMNTKVGMTSAAPQQTANNGFVKSSTVNSHNLTKDFCKFSNDFDNCWLNATLQALINMNTVRDAVQSLDPEVMAAISAMPATSQLFLDAVQTPGATFSPSEVAIALLELAHVIPDLEFGQQNDIADFINPLLCWLKDCGVQANLHMHQESRCHRCQNISCGFHDLGNMFFLPPQPGNTDSIASLLGSNAENICSNIKCQFCSSNVETGISFGDCDIFPLYVPRQSAVREKVTPDSSIYVPINGKKEQFNLSSVICHRSNHFYTYVAKDGVIVKANDSWISVADETCLADISLHGIIFLYEKCKETTAVNQKDVSAKNEENVAQQDTMRPQEEMSSHKSEHKVGGGGSEPKDQPILKKSEHKVDYVELFRRKAARNKGKKKILGQLKTAGGGSEPKRRTNPKKA